MRMPWLIEISDFVPTEQEVDLFDLRHAVTIPDMAAVFVDPQTTSRELGSILMQTYAPIGRLLVARGDVLKGEAANEYIRERVQNHDFAQEMTEIATTENLDLVLPSKQLFATIHFQAGPEATVRTRVRKPLLDFIDAQRSAGQAEASQHAC